MSFSDKTYDKIEDNMIYTIQERVLGVRKLADVVTKVVELAHNSPSINSGFLPKFCRYYAYNQSTKTDIFVCEWPPGWLKFKFSLERNTNGGKDTVNVYKVYCPTLIFLITFSREENCISTFFVFCSEHTMDRYGLNIRPRLAPLSNTWGSGAVCDEFAVRAGNSRWTITQAIETYLSGIFNNDLSNKAYDLKQWAKESETDAGIWQKIALRMPYIDLAEISCPVSQEERDNKAPQLWQLLRLIEKDNKQAVTATLNKEAAPITIPPRTINQDEDEDEDDVSEVGNDEEGDGDDELP